MNARNQMVCAWSGIAFILAFFVGYWVIAEYVPPHSPLSSAEQIAEVYKQNATQIRLGMMLTMLGTGFAMPWIALISVQLRRIEHVNPVLTYTQLISGTIGLVAVLVPIFIWTVAAYRPDRDPDTIMLMNDFAWVLFVMNVVGGIVQVLSIGIAILSDQGDRPVFPRWLGFFNLWVGVLFIPGALVPFFKAGPFAWNGLLAFWVPLFVFGAWFLVMFAGLRKAISQQVRV